jgi:hypothetical protein
MSDTKTKSGNNKNNSKKTTTKIPPAVSFSVLLMEILIAKLSSTLCAEKVLWVPHLFQRCDAFLITKIFFIDKS